MSVIPGSSNVQINEAFVDLTEDTKASLVLRFANRVVLEVKGLLCNNSIVTQVPDLLRDFAFLLEKSASTKDHI